MGCVCLESKIIILCYGYARYLPGFDKPMICFGDGFAEFVKERAAQNFANKHGPVLPSNAPATYDPMDSFDRRELTKDEFAKLTAELAAKYDPVNMAQEEYDSCPYLFLWYVLDRHLKMKTAAFADDLCHKPWYTC